MSNDFGVLGGAGKSAATTSANPLMGTSATPVTPHYVLDSGTGKYNLQAFTTPACNNDFPDDPASYAALAALWSQNVDGFTQQAIAGNPWNSMYSAAQTGYYNPLHTGIAPGSFAVDVAWIAFPNRLIQYLGQNQTPPNPYNLPQSVLNQLADSGELSKYPIPTVRCPQADWTGSLEAFGPYGPRGWLDEYCEFSVVRNAANKITRIDFTCENPEYYQTLWRISPERVCQVYEQALNTGAPPDQWVSVSVSDLQLLAPDGSVVIDPQTGRPAYNPLNRFNSGTLAVRGGTPAQCSGGAMHLTATPNTLQTELGLGAGATVQRAQGNTDPQALICCGQYGQNYRNSDPHIGQSINLAVSKNFNISLADPPGLYIQMPSFAQFQLPDDPKLPKGAKPSDCWHIIRGFEQLTDVITGQPYSGSFILHAAFQIPQAWIDAGVSFTVGDITIAGEPIQYGSQVQATLEIALFGRPIAQVAPTPALACVTGSPPATTQAQPLQIMFQTLWNAYYGTPVNTPAGVTMVLASNSSIIPPTLYPGEKNIALALTYAAPLGNTPLPETQWPTVYFTLPDGSIDTSVTATVTGYTAEVTYAVPGNTYPSASQLLNLEVSVRSTSPKGVRGCVIVPAGSVFSPSITPAPAFLVVANSSTAS